MHLIAGLGLAAEIAVRDARKRAEACRAFREQVLAALMTPGAVIHGDPARTLPHVLNLSFPGIDSEALMVTWKGLVAASNGSACTSHSYEPSHVLKAMALSDISIQGALRLSWSHLTPSAEWVLIADALRHLCAA